MLFWSLSKFEIIETHMGWVGPSFMAIPYYGKLKVILPKIYQVNSILHKMLKKGLEINVKFDQANGI